MTDKCCGWLAPPRMQEVRFQSKAGKILNYGKLSDTGGILCFCKNCHGKASGGNRWGSLGGNPTASKGACRLQQVQCLAAAPRLASARS